uniref:NADH-ubiquinone oxidoreductase chain 3 n=1 Tax=Megaselia spiracularis TaxID=940223 RepID=A0A6B9U3W9_9MUSC|nr:NADH dehydrogenase subunit 3 [Megaselia spiracularis]
MLMIFTIASILMLLSIVMILLATILSKKSILDREKCSPFECGFDPKSSSRLPFSLHFFLIAIIFLIFDVEIALILPMIITFNFSNMAIWFLTSSYFIVILLLGLYHEWNQGALNWTN